MARRDGSLSIDLELEILTPAFVGGAEPGQVDPYTPVRASAVRGMLRWWFRAAAASVLRVPAKDRSAHDHVVSKLRELEGKVFGNTGQRSSVDVMVQHQGSRRVRVFSSKDPSVLPGLRYLGYGPFDRSKGSQALEADSCFTLSLRARRSYDGLAELIGATVWLWTHLGAVGGRSRRGFGSLHLLSGAESLTCPTEHLIASARIDELGPRLSRGVAWALDVFETWVPRLTAYTPRGDGLHPRIRALADLRTFTVLPPVQRDGTTALDHAGRLFRDFRSTLERQRLGMPPLPDYFAVKSALQQGAAPRRVDRAAFGLPLRFYFRSLQGKSVTFLPRKPGGSGELIDRFASPLCFRVHRLAGAAPGYVTVLYNLAENGRPLLDLELAQRGNLRVPVPDGQLIEQFIEWARRRVERAPGGRS